MLNFRVRNIVPPGGRYFYEVADTKVMLEDLTLSGLLGRVRKHCIDNGLAVPKDLEAIVLDFMCRRLPEGFCYGDLDGRPRARVFTLQDIKARTLNLATGNPRVLVGEAQRRARICGQCKKNDRSVCPSCIGLVSWARRLVGQQLGAIDEWLGVCLVDGAALAAKIHLKNVPPDEEYPDNCWRTD